ncbi:unnamed protein product [Ilex paraguariensis]|uniref:Uncharacterized protein n=1 Tax=Ilex paraguariensis TaxID=185542 RepID=A0ABC8TFF0_9AQUA
MKDESKALSSELSSRTVRPAHSSSASNATRLAALLEGSHLGRAGSAKSISKTRFGIRRRRRRPGFRYLCYR